LRWIRYEREGRTSYGIAEDGEVEEVSGSPFTEYRRTGHRIPLAQVRLLVPVIPPTFYAAGLNYVEHVKYYATLGGAKPNLPQKPDIGYRAVNALIAHEEPVILPRDAGPRIHYEAELVVVIGRKAKHLSRDEALSCVLGYTIGNDVSERDWQKTDRTLWRAKNTDSWKPMGPWIETDFDLGRARTLVRVNGETTIDFATAAMLFGVEDYLSTMSRYLTLHPGDIIWMGTEGTSPDLKPGDVCEIEITGIGTLRNPFQGEG
jgi:2-keto-4-pentenoate hydratase/2-oxohepta-3-ene-1,7-dioic acid hydratase in catechol pathway